MKKYYRFTRRKLTKENLVKLFLSPDESPLRKSVAMALGVFIGVIPIWGGQVLSGIATAQYFKLNKPLVIIGTHINVTPLFPIIAFLSLKIGFLFSNQVLTMPELSQINFHLLQSYFWYFLIGSIPVAVVTASLFGLITYVSLMLFKSYRLVTVKS